MEKEYFSYGHWISQTPKPENAHSIVYKIIYKPNGKFYYGQKVLQNKIKRKPLKGKKRNRIDYRPSDWETYCGSGTVSEHAQEHPSDYLYLILNWCMSKLEADLVETNYILNNIHSDECLNQCVNVRCRVKKDPPDWI